MASFGDSFLDMAEEMLGKYNGSSSFEVLTPTRNSERNLFSEFEQICPNDNDASTASNSSNSQNDRQIYILDKKDERRSTIVVTPPKRRRMTGNYSAVEIIHALNRAMSKGERLEALENAMTTFDHNDRDLHDTEIEAGADIALVKHLVFIEYKASFFREPMNYDMEAILREIGSVLKCLEWVYRASSDAVGKSFDRVGKDLLQIIVILFHKENKNRLEITSTKKNDSPTSEENDDPSNAGCNEPRYIHDLMIRNATKIIGHFARVGKATRPMARFPGFIHSILNLCNIRPYSMIPFEARLSCLWTIANLACNVDNMTMMINTPNLIELLITISYRQPDSGDTVESIMEILRAKSIASRTLLNLSWSLENKVCMSQSPALVQALCQLALERQAPYKNSKTMQNILVQTRRNSLASLRNISAAPKLSKIALCNYNHGRLLDTLTDVILNETDQSIVNFSFFAIHNLAIHETAGLIVDRAALILALKNVMLEDNDNFSREEETHTIKYQYASATILVLERAITPDKSSYKNFRELLDTINPSDSTECADESKSRNASSV